MGNTIFHAIEHLHGVNICVTHVPGPDCYQCTRFGPTNPLPPLGGEENIFGESKDQFMKMGKTLEAESLALWLGMGYC
jgi:hypothetical protein